MVSLSGLLIKSSHSFGVEEKVEVLHGWPEGGVESVDISLDFELNSQLHPLSV